MKEDYLRYRFAEYKFSGGNIYRRIVSEMEENHIPYEKLESGVDYRILKYLKESLETSKDKIRKLYVLGEFTEGDLISIGVVGSRKITSYGKSSCNYIVEGLAAAGVTVVSGLMYGADLEAHKAALKAGGRTIAVLGYGFNYISSQNYAKETVKNILRNNQGVIISEYPPDFSPRKFTFVERNRIVAALTKGVVIVEADKKSGSLITANMALEQGKDVYAIPGSIFNSVSSGKHDLIKKGAAALIDSVDDILINYDIDLAKSIQNKNKRNLNAQERCVYEAIREELDPITIDELVNKTKIQLRDLNIILTTLELMDLIAKTRVGNIYVKR